MLTFQKKKRVQGGFFFFSGSDVCRVDNMPFVTVLTPKKTKKAFGFYCLVKHAERKTWDSPTLAEPAPNSPSPSHPTRKFRSQPASPTYFCYRDIIITFVEQSCVKWTKVKKAGRRGTNFGGGGWGGIFFCFFPPFPS